MKLDKNQQKQLISAIYISSDSRGYKAKTNTIYRVIDKAFIPVSYTHLTGVLAKHADEAGAWLHGVKVFRYSDETAEGSIGYNGGWGATPGPQGRVLESSSW